jgi:hypothetical protein
VPSQSQFSNKSVKDTILEAQFSHSVSNDVGKPFIYLVSGSFKGYTI